MGNSINVLLMILRDKHTSSFVFDFIYILTSLVHGVSQQKTSQEHTPNTTSDNIE